MNTLIRKLSITLPIAVILLVVVEILFTNHLASYGGKIYDMDGKIAAIERQNNLLETHIASASSFMTIQVKAAEFGFIEPVKSQFVSIITEQPVAFNQPQ